MTLAWLCYTDPEDNEPPIIVFEEPNRYRWFLVRQIVFAYVKNDV